MCVGEKRTLTIPADKAYGVLMPLLHGLSLTFTVVPRLTRLWRHYPRELCARLQDEAHFSQEEGRGAALRGSPGTRGALSAFKSLSCLFPFATSVFTA